jgi:flavin reductase (DIM6/NTAB) family NADH-FMN oxidoreductase RutF
MDPVLSGVGDPASRKAYEMFYHTSTNDHGLPFDPFKAIVAPRPIGWISSISAKGEVNLAPYSFFNAISGQPPCVMFSSDGYKDSVANIAETREFVCNLATWDLREAVNQTSATLPRGSNEMEKAGLAATESRLVEPPRVAAAPCALECKLLQIIRLDDLEGRALDQYVVIGQVVGVHIEDRFLRDGRLDTAAMQPIGRCGYSDYAVVTSVFQMKRPV